jgi:hypothetical protein
MLYYNIHLHCNKLSFPVLRLTHIRIASKELLDSDERRSFGRIEAATVQRVIITAVIITNYLPYLAMLPGCPADEVLHATAPIPRNGAPDLWTLISKL